MAKAKKTGAAPSAGKHKGKLGPGGSKPDSPPEKQTGSTEKKAVAKAHIDDKIAANLFHARSTIKEREGELAAATAAKKEASQQLGDARKHLMSLLDKAAAGQTLLC